MKLLSQMSAVAQAMRLRSDASSYRDAFFAGDVLPDSWMSSLSAAGVNVTADLAMTLSAFYGGVTMIAYDLSTLPLQIFATRDDGGKDRVKPFFGAGIDSSNGIRSLTYMLRWQPNLFQTATEFWMGLLAQWLLRGRAYAEIISGPTGFVSQLLPRHPDRVVPERLPSGRLRFRLTEAMGQPRYVTQDEMFVIRDLSLDGGVNSLSRVQYGANAIGTILAAERAAGKFFKTGMTAALLATYTGDMEDEDEAALHASIGRYAAGVENSFGLMLVPDDVKVSNLAIEPEKAQMMAARDFGLREVARLLRIPPHKLAIRGTQTYASQVQSSLEYVIDCLRPIAVIFEQAIQRDLILVKDKYFSEFLLEALLRGDPQARSEYYERAIRFRWMRPSEVRLRENMNPDPDLDRLSESDFRPGEDRSAAPTSPPASARAAVKGVLALHDQAVRCVTRERVAVEKLAKKHAGDVPHWQASLREFFLDHAAFVARTMRLPIEIARGYAAQHGSELEARGIVVYDEHWERCEADALAVLAHEGDRAA